MKTLWFRLFGCQWILLLLMVEANSQVALPVEEIDRSSIEKLLKKNAEDLLFEENIGQWESSIQFKGQTAQSSVRFLSDKVSIAVLEKETANTLANGSPLMIGDSVKMNLSQQYEAEKEQKGYVWNMAFVGMSAETKLVAKKEADVGQRTYLRKDKTYQNPQSYEEVWYENIYESTDLRFYGRGNGSLEYDFIIYPKGDVGNIGIDLEGIENYRIAANGELILETPLGELRKGKPYTYQKIGGKEKEIASAYKIKEDGRLGFEILEAYDKTEPLILDPIAIIWSTYLGNFATFNTVQGLAVGADGSIYICGNGRAGFPTTVGAFQVTNGGIIDAIVIKISSDGSTIIWSTYLGGNTVDQPFDLEVSASGEVYICGITSSNDFPTTVGVVSPNIVRSRNGFISKLNASGSALEWSTYIGLDNVNDIALSPLGEVYGVGNIRGSGGIAPTAGAYQNTLGESPTDISGNIHWSVFRLNNTATAYDYVSYYGARIGSSKIKIDGAGDVYIAGKTFDFYNILTTAGAYQTAQLNPVSYYVTKMDGTLSTVIYATYLGGSDHFGSFDFEITPTGEAVILGSTGGDYPTTAGSYQPTFNDLIPGNAMVVSKLNAAGSDLVFSTYLGEISSGKDLSIGNNGDLLILGYAGSTAYPAYPTTIDAILKTGPGDIFSKLSGDGSELIYSTFLEKEQRVAYQHLRETLDGGFIFGGIRTSPGIVPTTLGTIQPEVPSVRSWILSKYNCVPISNNTIAPLSQTTCVLANPEMLVGSDAEINTVQTYEGDELSGYNELNPVYQWQRSIDNMIWTDIPGAGARDYLPTPTAVVAYYRRIVYGGMCCASDTSGVAILNVNNLISPSVDPGIPQSYCSGGSAVLGGMPTASGGSPPYTYEWTPAIGLDDPSIANPTASSIESTIYTIKVTDANNCVRQNQVVTSVVMADAGPNKRYCENSGIGVSIGTPGVLSIPAFTYSWSPVTGLSDPTIAQPIASPSVVTDYVLSLTGGSGCPSTDVVRVIPVVLTADAGPDISVCYQDRVQIGGIPVGGYSYLWTPGTYLEEVDVPNPIFNAFNYPSPNPEELELTVIDVASGCFAKDSLRVEVDFFSFYFSQSICYTDPGGVQIGSPSEPDYTYSWSPGTNLSCTSCAQPIANPAVPTTYTVSISNVATNCMFSDTILVFKCGEQPVGNEEGGLQIEVEEICLLNGSVQIGPEEPNPAYDYSWTPTIGLSDPNIAQPIASPPTDTTYRLRVTYKENPMLFYLDSIRVIHPSIPLGLAGLDMDICPGEMVEIGSPAIVGYSYSWTADDGSLSDVNVSNPIASPPVNSQYILEVFESITGCLQYDTVVVDARGAIADAGADMSFCEGALVTMGIPAVPNHIYSWNPSGGLDDGMSAQPNIILFISQEFILRATDTVTNCESLDTVFFTKRDPLLADAGPETLSYCPGSPGVMLGTTDSTAYGYTYYWSPSIGLSNANVANPVANPGSTTEYTLYVSSSFNPGCQGTDKIVVEVMPGAVPPGGGGEDKSTCPGEGVQIGEAAAAGFIYSWTPLTGLDDGTIAQPMASPGASTTYVLMITDEGTGCSTIDSVEVSLTDFPIANGGGDRIVCVGDSIQIGMAAIAGCTYMWTPAMGLSNPRIAQPMASPGGTQSYVLEVMGIASSCIARDTILLSVSPFPLADAGPDVSFCNTGVMIGTAAVSGLSYSWSPPFGLNSSSIPQPVASPEDTTDYILTVQNQLSLCRTTDTVRVSPSFSINAGSNEEICRGESVLLGSPSIGGLTYSWSPSFGLNSSSIAEPVASPMVGRIYTLMISDGSCSRTDNIEIMVNEAVADAGSDELICEGGSVQIGSSPLSNYSYAWFPSDSLDNSMIANPFIRTSEMTELVVAATNLVNGCVAKDTTLISIFPLEAPFADAGPDLSFCMGVGERLGTSSIPDNTYSWSPVVGLDNPLIAQPLANPLSSTIYSVTVTNANGCTSGDAVVVVPFIQSAEAGFNQSICLGGSTTLFGTDQGEGKSYEWFPSEGLSDPSLVIPLASPLVSTTYSLQVTDIATGCVGWDTVRVTVDESLVAPNADAGPDMQICMGESVQIGSEGEAGVFYSWSFSFPFVFTSNRIVSPTATTTYIVNAQSLSSSCRSTDEVVVTVDEPLIADAGMDQNICVGGSGVVIGTPGDPACSYSWFPETGLSDPSIAQPLANPTSSTFYTLRVIRVNNGISVCEASDEVSITVNGLPVANAGMDMVNCPMNPIQLGTPGILGHSYSWSPTVGLSNANIANPLASPDITTTYIVTVSYDATGCSSMDTMTVVVNCELGVSKNANKYRISGNGDGSYDVIYSILIENLGISSLYDILLTDDLGTTFGTLESVVGNVDSPGEYAITATPMIIETTAGATILSLNPFYDGSGNITILEPSSGEFLPPGSTITIEFGIRFYPFTGITTFITQAMGSGDGAENGLVDGIAIDLSDDALDLNPDPDHDGIANELGENDPTIITITDCTHTFSDQYTLCIAPEYNFDTIDITTACTYFLDCSGIGAVNYTDEETEYCGSGLFWTDPLTTIRYEIVKSRTRTWLAEYENGNETLLGCIQTIYEIRPLVSNVLINSNIELDCGEIPSPLESSHDLALFDLPYVAFDSNRDGVLDSSEYYSLYDSHGSCNYLVTWEDTEAVAHCGGEVFVRTWHVHDWCGTDSSAVLEGQIVSVEDRDSPYFTNCPDDIDPGGIGNPFEFSTSAYSCEAIVTMALPPAEDACTEAMVYELGVYELLSDGTENFVGANLGLLGELEIGEYYVSYRAADECGNTTNGGIGLLRSDCRQYFRVIDEVEPQASCDDILQISINDVGRIYAENIEESSYDNCEIAQKLLRRMYKESCASAGLEEDTLTPGWTSWESYIDVYCCDINENLMVEFYVEDEWGNSSVCWTTVVVEDKIIPVCEQMEAFSLSCERADSLGLGRTTSGEWVSEPLILSTYDNLFGEPDFYTSDNCGVTEIESSILIEGGDCGRRLIRRRYRGFDQSGNVSTYCEQDIEVNYIRDWSLMLPDDWSGECGDLPTVAMLNVESGGCDLLGWDYEDEVYETGDGCYKILRTYKIHDWCGLETVDISNAVILPRLEPEEAMGYEVLGSTYGDSVNYFEYTQILEVIDEEVPVLSMGEEVLSCLTESDCTEERTFSVNGTDCGDETGEDLIYSWEIRGGEILLASGTGNSFSWEVEDSVVYAVEFRGLDNCGNTAILLKYYEFENCNMAGISCLDSLVVGMMEEEEMVVISASDFEMEFVEICGDTSANSIHLWHHSLAGVDLPQPGEEGSTVGSLPNSLEFGCNELGTQTVYVFVLDSSGHWSFCTSTVIVEAENEACSDLSLERGATMTEWGEGIEQTKVIVSENGENLLEVETRSDGGFEFNVLSGSNYNIWPENKLDPVNGVSTFDIVLLTEHLLGINELTSAYVQIAGDVNKSGSLSVFDIVLMRQLILGQISAFPENDSWRFVSSKYEFTSTDILQESFWESINMTEMEEEELIEFVGIKIGDINGTAVPNNAWLVEDREEGSKMEIEIPDILLEKGEIYEIPFSYKNMDEILGYQFSLEFDPEVLEYIGLVEGLSNGDHFGLRDINKGSLLTSWHAAEGVSGRESHLFSLQFRAHQSGKLIDLLGINKGNLEAEAYTVDHQVLGVSLLGEAECFAEFILYPNRPNPFKEKSLISFNLPKSGQAILRVSDVSGEEVKVLSGYYKKGYHEVWLREFPSPGVYYYQLETADNVAVRKMIVLN